MSGQHIAVLMGGFSSEREVSLRSGAAVAQGLRQKGYRVSTVDVSAPRLSLPPGVDVAFIALHGEFGEDGQVQALLQQEGVPYTGSGPAAARLAFDKVLTKKRLQQQGIATAEFAVLQRAERCPLPWPVVVKPVRQGSSFGVHCVRTTAEWDLALEDALSYNGEVIVEPFIDGKELTVGLIDEEVLPVIEICAPDNNYDYRAKYTQGLTKYLVPAPLDAQQTARCQLLARQTYQALGARGMGRVDLRLAADNSFYVLELNTIPGFTETSLLPKAALAAGYSFVNLCQRLVELASLDEGHRPRH
jgi:D-alanine-D-alanine ligase